MGLESTIKEAYTTKKGDGVLVKSNLSVNKKNFFNDVRELVCTYLLEESIGGKILDYKNGQETYTANLDVQGTNVNMGKLTMKILPTQLERKPLDKNADYAVSYTENTQEKMLLYINNARQEEHARNLTEHINKYK